MTDYKEIWHTLIEDTSKSWVVFENGTCVILMQPSADLSQQAKTLLSEYISTTASSEFSVLELDVVSGWVIGWQHPDILNFVAPYELFEGLPKDMQAGLVGRQHRNDDAEQLKIVYIHAPQTTNSPHDI
ncbi:MAG: hypothetical protein GC179_00685 [Anaerolineaceae bacterium]|nr:hypothetical protein [Anaerolineaceae bacterium]